MGGRGCVGLALVRIGSGGEGARDDAGTAVVVMYAFAQSTYLPACGIVRLASVVTAAGTAIGPLRNRA